MNLSNENVYGCRQVALVGGLQTISALAVTCCKSVALSVGNGDDSIKSSFQFGISPSGDAKSKSRQCGSDDMDLLIVVLGVLVNLVEKDESNRSVGALPSCLLSQISTPVVLLYPCRSWHAAILIEEGYLLLLLTSSSYFHFFFHFCCSISRSLDCHSCSEYLNM